LISILISQLQEFKNQVSSHGSSKPPNQSPLSSLKLRPENQNHESFLSVINCIDFQKSYASVTIMVKQFKLHSIALLDSGCNAP